MHAFFRIFYTRLMMGIAHHHSRLYLLLPVLLACGLYLGLIFPLSLWWGIVMIMVALVGWSVAPYVFVGMGGYAFRAVMVVMLGMAWVNGWISNQFHYAMPYGGVVAVQGTVADIIYKNGKIRYVLSDTRGVRLRDKGQNIDKTMMDAMVDLPHVHIGGTLPADFTPNIGDRIVGKGIILSHFAPDFVGGFSITRYLLERGMMGYVNSTKKYAPSWSVQDRNEVGGTGYGQSIQTGIAQIRHSIMEKIKNTNYGNETQGTVGTLKSIAIALMVGKRDFMTDADNQAIRDAGLAHVMAISGMHVGLLIAIVFFVMRRCLCLIPAIALRYDTKILAVLVALPVALFYVLISGMGIPAVRALGMAGLALLGVLLYRNALTVRIVVVIACAMMLYNPLWFMQAGFLLSFSAVLGLVIFAEFYGRWLRNLGNNKPFYSKGIVGYGFGIFCASGIATLATLPTVVQYFGVFPLYGIVANMIVVPLVSLWVMPMGVLSGIAMLFGLENLVLGGMLMGIEVMMDVAYWVQALPHAVMHLQALPPLGYAVVMVVGIWGCLLISNRVTGGKVMHRGQGSMLQSNMMGENMDRKPRNFMVYLAIVVFTGGIFMAQLTPLPVVMVNKTATTYGVRSAQGIVIAGWTKTMYRDSIVASVAQRYGISRDEVQQQKCDRKSICTVPIAMPVWGDNFALLSSLFSGTIVDDIFTPKTAIRNLVIVPYKSPVQPITEMCQSPENAIILAPKVHIDYGKCKIPVLGKADFANMGSVTLFWDNNGIKLQDDSRDVVIGRQGKTPLPYVPQN